MRRNFWLVVMAALFLPASALGMEMETPPHALGAALPSIMPSVPPNAPPGHAVKSMAPYKADNPTSRSATEALNLLESEGYANFTNFRQDGTRFLAEETQNGRTWQLAVDPKARTIVKMKKG